MTTMLLDAPAEAHVPATDFLWGRRLRIAWVCPFVPKPEFGGAVRCYHLIRAAAARHDVEVLALEGDDKWPQGFLPQLIAHRGFAPDTTWEAAKGRSILSTRSQSWVASRSRALERHLAEHAADYDVVVCEFTRMGFLPIPEGPLRVLDLHNIEHELLFRTAAQDHPGLRRLYRWQDAVKLRREEKAAVRAFDLVATCSERETNIAQEWAHNTRVVSAPNGVDVAGFAPPGNVEKTAELLFLGTMNYFPNVQAVRHFHDNILPRLLERRPGTRVRIVGVNPTPEIVALNRPGFEVVGGVPDVRPEYWSAKALIVPLLSGSGTRLKILEAAGAGLPIVSTPLGCEGIDMRHGEHLMVAESPDEFAEACVRLLDNEALAARLAMHARALVHGRYDWQRIGDALIDQIEAELASRGARR